MLFDAKTGKAKTAKLSDNGEEEPLLLRYGGWVNVARFAPDGESTEVHRLAAGSYDTYRPLRPS